MTSSALALLSGGIDSAALLHFLIQEKFEVTALHIDYGQKARKPEALAAQKIAEYFEVPLKRVAVEGLPLPENGEIVGRNSMLACLGLSVIESDASVLCMGIHSGTSYWDCSEAFAQRMSLLLSDGTSGRVELFTPFLTWTKAEVVAYFNDKKIPIECTYSCELGTTPPCGHCQTCLDLKELL